MTGRKGRVVSNDDGTITYESRSELDVPVEILNLTEKQRFMDGEKVNKFPFNVYLLNMQSWKSLLFAQYTAQVLIV